MKRIRGFLARNRTLFAALCISLLAHAAILAGAPDWGQRQGEEEPVRFDARLVPAEATQSKASSPAPSPAKKAKRPRLRPMRPDAPIAMLESDAVPPPIMRESEAAPAELAAPVLLPEPPPRFAQGRDFSLEPEQIALAAPSTFAPVPGAPKFDATALPESLSIEYELKSAFADGRAEYTWSREGTQYSVRSVVEAIGFFTLFLEGRIVQESHGEVTAEGLKPAGFLEKRGNSPDEGLAFDWAKREVTFIKGDERKTGVLIDNTVDWLSMIFQLAHMPPPERAFDIHVFTQRRMYNFHLEVLGLEEIEIPLGRMRALHLRHNGMREAEQVDVWLSPENHYLPVKMRFPVARNRLVVEQDAVRITGR